MSTTPITIQVEHAIGDIVYLKTDEKQLTRIVLGYLFDNENVKYHLASINLRDFYFGIEITAIQGQRVYDSNYDQNYD